jgi:small-conductance mechanosensitive channel
MNPEISILMQDLFNDTSSPVILWQIGIIFVALSLAWSINGLLKKYIMQQAPETWKVGIGGIKRILFPSCSLLIVYTGQLVLKQWQHVSMLKLAETLLIAMTIIRLAVYALRYIFAPGGWVRALEGLIATIVWILLALHLTGLLPNLLQTLEDVSFKVGKTDVNLLIVLQGVFTIVFTLFIALSLSRLLENRLMQTQQINMNMRVVLTKLLRILFSFIAVLVGLSVVGLDITLLSVFGGAIGIGLGFGLQKITSNYVSGFIILMDKSMQIGDVVTIENHYGIVGDLRSRYLVLNKLDGTQVIIPNETLITSMVINHSLTDRKSRVQLPIQISYDSDLENAMNIMREIAVKHPRVIQDPAPSAYILAFGESGIDLNLNCWIIDPEEGSTNLKSAIYLEIWRAFQASGIVIPYPQREIRLLGDVAINNKSKAT